MTRYEQIFNKLTEAYIANKVNPFDNCACFIGNMCNNTQNWAAARSFVLGNPLSFKIWPEYLDEATNSINRIFDNFYTIEEIYSLECIFLNTLRGVSGSENWLNIKYTEKGEESLFQAFVTTLEALKQLHISKGEVIDQVPVFKKRELIA